MTPTETPADHAPLKTDDLNPRAALGLLTRAEAAAVLGKSEETLRQWAVRRKGPPRTRYGTRCYYSFESIKKWVKSHEEPIAER